VRRTSMQLAAAVLACGLAVTACGNSLKAGAAATTGSGRVTSATLTNQVANLNAAYKTDTAKGVKPQRPVGQAAQQVLTWLITFQVFNKLAQQHGIAVTPAQVQKQLASLTAQAKQEKVSLATYVSAAGAVPPDLMPQIGRYFAIVTAFENRIDGGKAPTAQAGQQAVETRLAHAQCLAAKNLNIKVNPQYGEFDYTSFSVVAAPSKLAASQVTPTPTPTTQATSSPSAKPRLTPNC
jgi:SurA N-terminal domain